MIILGLGLIVYEFIKRKKFSQKPVLYPIIALPVLVLGIYLAFSAGAFEDRNKRLTDEERRNEQIEKI